MSGWMLIGNLAALTLFQKLSKMDGHLQRMTQENALKEVKVSYHGRERVVRKDRLECWKGVPYTSLLHKYYNHHC